MSDKIIRMTLREFREMLREMLEDDVPAAPSTGKGGKCNCENSYCEHVPGECSSQAGTIQAQYVGALCDDCGERMPEQYRLKPSLALGGRRKVPRGPYDATDRRAGGSEGRVSRGPGPRRAPGPRKPGGGLPWREN